ncbi:MAG: 4-hydroxy-3-methylbut-2-en-1-yl diphosphate synthase [Deltaproteobacteria bacterium HGW-Deltaproteobacteria-19]|nr:MAG: 4-hydroxy-3-methylbut-2-en-1-yl diphosphate synthase [Deltaproteobacteria bacterium HGW-Deltaproteobacteria-19]
MRRRQTRSVLIGGVQIGGDAPVVVQSMTSTDTRNVEATVRQIGALQEAGCEIVRAAVPDEEAALALKAIRERISLPLVADIHFDHRLALAAMESGADAIRINPGNMKREKLPEVVRAAGERGIPIRVGINAGSLEKDLLDRYGGPVAEALVESALRNVRLLEDLGFTAIKVSLKSSDVPTMIEAYREISRLTDYPLHVGVTEAGTLLNSAVKSAIGIGTLLYEGIGDTIRVSVTGDPVPEVRIAYGILRALNIRAVGPDIIACPTCGRCEIDLLSVAEEVERRVAGMREPLKIAIMGCVVNGPGEAAEADIGIAGGKRAGMLFKKGKPVRKVAEGDLVKALLEELAAMTGRRTL